MTARFQTVLAAAAAVLAITGQLYGQNSARLDDSLAAYDAPIGLPSVTSVTPASGWESNGCNSCCTGCQSCQACPAVREGLFDNFSLFGGLEGSKQPQDFGVNAHFGGRAHMNWGVPLIPSLGIGGQIGSGLNYTDNAVQVVERVQGTKDREQYFQTVGLFQSTENFRWGVAYDFLNQDYFDSFALGQWRVKAQARLTSKNEVGVWAAITGRDDLGFFGDIPVIMQPISQGNVYWTHVWNHEARTTLWAGMTEGHHESNVALGDLPYNDNSFVFGAEVHIPLNNYLALFGQANFISPSDTGTVDAYLGLAFYPAAKAYSIRRQRFSPLFAVANNPTFSVDLYR